ncbi:inositol oxygenase-like [Anneissia japonica]|uniref:inositol oxygenase-like n=1 Tax=Anneissia japonica TaxID=1529436 RepID=UPI0014255638|nr:inositol oxygenase-like [Anneissia japonica]
MEPVFIIDPSELYRPEHNQDFRNFENASNTSDEHMVKVKRLYKNMHTQQTVEYVKGKQKYWGKLDKKVMTIMEALEFVNQLVDESDPDIAVPNIYHAYQTAERIREKHPDKEWFHLVGLIHDLGKILAIWNEPQWCVVGDTFPVGCLPSDSIVYGRQSFVDNVDIKNPKYNTRLGMYEENCGLDKVLMSWGHDEYMYQVCRGNKQCKLPLEALYMIRFHSFYPWHTNSEYYYLCNTEDIQMLSWVKEFNQFDLYSKSDELPDIEALKPYYQSLIDKYFPGKIKW